jgi:hypothetical protein
MQMLQSSMDSCLLAAITNHLLNVSISQVMLINMSRLATYANHASVTQAVYEITFFRDYKIVNVNQEYIMQTITTSGALCLNAVNKPSSISEDVTETQINSQPYKENNLTTRHTRATKANEWPPFAMTIKESGRVLPHSSVVFHPKASWAVRGWPDTIPSEQLYNKVSYRPAQRSSSYLVSGGISARMRQYTTQMLV